MNATGDSDENPELLTSGTPGLPLSAPVVAGMLQTRELSVHFREPDDSPPARHGAPRPSVSPQPAGLPHRPAEHAAPAAVSPAHLPPAAEPGGHDPAPQPAPRAESVMADWSADDPPEDPNRVLIRKHLDAVRVSAANASSWLETGVHYARLLNRDGVVPVTARFTPEDIEFLGRAREQVLGFAELGLRLLELHAPLDAGGISTDPSSPILRCRSCMWRWPCPTFRMLSEALSHLPTPGSPPVR